jgi:hypothetical protein
MAFVAVVNDITGIEISEFGEEARNEIDLAVGRLADWIGQPITE